MHIEASLPDAADNKTQGILLPQWPWRDRWAFTSLKWYVLSLVFFPMSKMCLSRTWHVSNVWIILQNWILTAFPTTGALAFVYCFRLNQIHSALIPIHVSALQSCASSRLHAAQLGNHRRNPDVHFLWAPPPLSLSLPLLPVSHAKLHPAQMHANTVPVAEERISKLHKKKKKKKNKTSVTQASCVVSTLVGGSFQIPSLLSNHVSIKVKSCFFFCFFFFVEQGRGQTCSIIEGLEKNSTRENVLATEMSWKQNQHAQAVGGTRDRGLVLKSPTATYICLRPNGTLCFSL